MNAKNLIKLYLVLLLVPGCFFTGESHMALTKIENKEQLESLFPKSPKEIDEMANCVISQVQDCLKQIYNVKIENRNFENTAKKLDILGSNLGSKAAAISVLEMVSPNKEIREAAHQAAIKLNNFSVDNLSQNKKLYESFKDYAENNAKTENLNDVQKYFLKEEMEGFKLSGLHLSDENQEKLKELKKELSHADLRFSRNIAQDNRSIKIEKEGLEGLSDNFINNLQKTNDDLYILGVDYPTYYYVMENAKKEDTRKKLWKEFSNRGYPQNESELKTIIALRDQMAKILGFKSYAELDIYDQMAKTPQCVEGFLNNLVDKATTKAKEEVALLTKDLPEGVSLTKNGKIKSWDASYIKNYYKKKYLNINEEKIAEYFPLKNTLNELFKIYEKFFGITFEEENLTNIWDPQVQLLKVYKTDTSGNSNKSDNKFIGHVLLDLFPRENKYSHACQVGIVSAVDNQDGYFPAVVLVIANFPKPTKERAALLKRNDVTTFFHEFGHAIHSLLGATSLSSLSGTRVKRDFVEMPSQMLEEWMWQPEILKQISKHYETGEQLPEEQIKKIIALKQFDSGLHVLGQLFYSFIALEYFKEGANKDPYEISEKLYKQILTPLEFDKDYRFYNSFGHLTGYGAKYYGYLWSKVFAIDLFDYIKKQGYFDGIGEKYIKEVIGKGGSQDPDILLKNFLGRAPKEDAFIKDLGL